MTTTTKSHIPTLDSNIVKLQHLPQYKIYELSVLSGMSYLNYNNNQVSETLAIITVTPSVPATYNMFILCATMSEKSQLYI